MQPDQTITGDGPDTGDPDARTPDARTPDARTPDARTPDARTPDAGCPDAGAVLRFLTANPDFFEQHREVLPRLSIPHASGKAVSLIERQVNVLRSQCLSLENHLRDLIGVAHANERLQGRLHTLVQEIISADSLDAVVDATCASLAENFGADTVHVLLADVPAGDAYRTCDADDARLVPFAELLEAGGTRCGLPTDAELDALVDEDARAGIGSAALVPLKHDGTIGIVMLTSRDESRFAVGKGVVFLDQLGGVLSRRVRAFLGTDPSGAGLPGAEHPEATSREAVLPIPDSPEATLRPADAADIELPANRRLPA